MLGHLRVLAVSDTTNVGQAPCSLSQVARTTRSLIRELCGAATCVSEAVEVAETLTNTIISKPVPPTLRRFGSSTERTPLLGYLR